MRLSDIKHLAKEGESSTVEFKKSTGQLSRAAETICAFLNDEGGRVIIGVTPEGKIVGQQVTDKTLRDIATMLQKFEPPAPVSTIRIPIANSKLELIVLEARPSEEARPFTLSGRPYYRIGTTTSVMPQERYQELLLARIHSRHRWENAQADMIDIGQLDHEEILRTMRAGVAAGRLPQSTGQDIGDILEKMGLSVNRQIVNAAVVLFGRRFLPEYPQCQLRMARFKGIDKAEFLDNRQVQGHAFQLLDEAMLFLQRHLPVAGRIQPGLFERIDEPLFPAAALREALVNAFCHRDYAHAGGAVSIAIYDDRLEIWSDGSLPFGLRVEDLKRDHPSRPRNPLIADVFYRRGLVERWGRGTQSIVDLCVRAGHPEPEFVEQAGAVGVLFLPSEYIAPHRVAHDLTARQREILQILAGSYDLPLRFIMKALKDPPASATVRDDLYHLKRLGLIDSKGHGRGAVWFLVKRPPE
ncbi:MAG: putative DNA binding domain-containing protein [Deltaproteobacteria bacterium]|nr:putative DNA binding domain-containing protein [Deltaproteobacteria bacterium]MBW2071429.1 putative DNA binding domain-containing protein [Deltaproteobacteria bacterium]